LSEINAVIGQAVLAWPLPERIRQLSVPLLQYDDVDASHFRMIGACLEGSDGLPGGLAGVGVWDDESVHGLYVHPLAQRGGIGRCLLEDIAARASHAGIERLLIKAQRVSAGYFLHLGLADASSAFPYPNAFLFDTRFPLSPR
jgi:GNAT superfamily N-acetyltransferase